MEKLKNEIKNRVDYICSVEINHRVLKFYTNAYFPLKRVHEILLAEPETLAWLNHSTPKSVFWDIGANMGVYSLYAAQVCQHTVLAFEPEAGNFALLNKNIALNNFNEHITAYPVGLSDRSGPGILYRYHDFESAALNSLDQEVDVFLKPMKAKYTQGIVGYTGDELVHNHHFTVPDLIKIDVDGLEHLIVKGLDQTLNKSQTLLVEMNFKIKEHQEILKTMMQKGFYVHDELCHMTTISGGDLDGMCNVVFHKKQDVLKKIFTEAQAIYQSERFKDYISAANENSDYYDPQVKIQIETVEHK